MSKPLVSIITSTYNRTGLLRRSIDSVRAQQGAPEWEMCIVGDCTPDNTAEVVASYGDERLRFFNLPEKSPPRAHGAIAKNHGIFQMARGKWIAYLDDDDAYAPDFLREMFAAVESNPGYELAYCRAIYRDKDTGRRIWGNPFHGALKFSRERLERYNFLISNGVLHSRRLIEETGGWDSGDYFDDYDLWKRMAQKHDFLFVNQALCVVYTKADPFFKRLVTKGVKILLHGRRLEDQG